MEKIAIKNRESCRLDWIGIPGCSIQQLLRNQKYVELTSKLIPRFRRGFSYYLLQQLTKKFQGTPMVLFPRFQRFSESRGFTVSGYEIKLLPVI